MKPGYSLPRGLSVACAATFVWLFTACASVPPSVRGLVQMQTDMADKTVKDADQLAQDAQSKAERINNGVKALDRSMQAIQTAGAMYALVFSANQNLETKSGIDATAAAYMVAEIYLADQAGLSSSVKEQFAESEAALQKLAKDWKVSWQNIQKTQKLVHEYSEKSPVSAIDPSFVAAVAGEVPGADARLAALLTRMKELKSALDQASTAGAGKVKGVGQVRSVAGELVDLLESIGKSKAAK